VFLSNTVLHGKYNLHLAIGNYQTSERHVGRAWELVTQAVDELAQSAHTS
jgi:hypothetical protein